MAPQRRLPTPRTRMLSVHRIKEMISKGEIQLDAPYQREIIWEQGKMSELIDSIINNYYIPPLLFAVRMIRGKPVRIVIDGKQRLTSARRFLKNLLPYIDTSSGNPVEKYYTQTGDQDADTDFEKTLRESQSPPTNFITDEEFDVFNKFEFVCVEYLDITEDDEFEIFSRVQLGVAITSAEKLKATNTKIAKCCRQLAEENQQISQVFQRKGIAALFQLIAHLMLTIKNGTETFASNKALQTYVHSNEIPSPQLIDKVEYVLSVIKNIAVDKDLKNVYTKSAANANATHSLKAIEFIVFGTYISLVERTRSNKNYARDFESLRNYLIEKREGRAYLGKESFSEMMVWANERLEKENLISARLKVHRAQDDNEDVDELKEEDAIPAPNKSNHHQNRRHRAPEVQPPAPVQQRNTPAKRRRESRGSIGVAVAKRGGKLPTGLKRNNRI